MARKSDPTKPLSWYMKNKLRNEAAAAEAAKPKKIETDEQIRAKLHERFNALDELTQMCIRGDARSLIVSGPGGLGKSFTVEKRMETWDPKKFKHTIVKGFVRPTGLYRLAYEHRAKGEVIIFDDSDSIFRDADAMNLLKSMCDTTENRYLMWGAETKMEDENGEALPTQFLFEGTVIFISNLDFDKIITQGGAMAPHLEAMVSRSHYIDMAMHSRRDYLIRIQQVINQGMLDHLNAKERSDVVAFINTHQDNLRELSLRMAIKLANLRKGNDNWQRIAKITCCKGM